MRLFRPLPVLVALLTLTVAVACSSDAPTPPRALAPAAPARSLTAAADFHRTNKHDWVGVAHNRVLDKFFAGLAKHHGPTDACAQLTALISDPEMVPAEHRAEHTVAAMAIGLQALSNYCPEQVGQVAAGTVSLASFELAQSTTLSPAAETIIAQLRAANASAANSTDLANQYNAILPASAYLSSGESDVVNATASVGLSSLEYWETNLTATQSTTQSAYGGCIQASTTDVDGTILTCVGMTQPAPIVRVRFDGPSPNGLWLVQGTCVNGSFGGLLEVDFEAAAGAAVGAFIISTPVAPVSVPVAAFGAAAGTSTAYAVWNSAKDIWCRFHSGGTPATTKKT